MCGFGAITNEDDAHFSAELTSTFTTNNSITAKWVQCSKPGNSRYIYPLAWNGVHPNALIEVATAAATLCASNTNDPDKANNVRRNFTVSPGTT